MHSQLTYTFFIVFGLFLTSLKANEKEDYYKKQLDHIQDEYLHTNPKKALIYLQNIEEESSNEELFEITADALFLIYICYDNLDDFENSFSTAKKFEKIAQKTQNNLIQYQALLLLTNEYLSKGYLDQANDYNQKTLPFINSFEYPKNIETMGIYNNLEAKLAAKQNKPFLQYKSITSNIKNYNKLDSTSAHYSKLMASTYQNLGLYFLDLPVPELDSAKLYLNKALSYAESPKTKGALYSFLAEVDFKNKAYTESLEKYLYSAKIADSIQNPHNLSSAYKSIAEVYQKLNDSIKAAQYNLLYLKLNDSLQNVKKGVQLQVHKELLEKNLSNQKRFYVYIVLIIISLALLILFLFYYKKKLSTIFTSKKKTANLLSNKYKIDENLIELAKTDETQFLIQFKKEHTTFFNKLTQLAPDITNNELFYCALIKLNFTNKEIAEMTFVTLKAIEVKRYRIKKKLNLVKGTDFVAFIKSIT